MMRARADEADVGIAAVEPVLVRGAEIVAVLGDSPGGVRAPAARRAAGRFEAGDLGAVDPTTLPSRVTTIAGHAVNPLGERRRDFGPKCAVMSGVCGGVNTTKSPRWGTRCLSMKNAQLGSDWVVLIRIACSSRHSPATELAASAAASRRSPASARICARLIFRGAAGAGASVAGSIALQPQARLAACPGARHRRAHRAHHVGSLPGLASWLRHRTLA
jgi:hypothetical protein